MTCASSNSRPNCAATAVLASLLNRTSEPGRPPPLATGLVPDSIAIPSSSRDFTIAITVGFVSPDVAHELGAAHRAVLAQQVHDPDRVGGPDVRRGMQGLTRPWARLERSRLGGTARVVYGVVVDSVNVSVLL